MKKQFLQKQRGILLALLCFLCVTSINAQTWPAPALTGSTPASGTTYYMYNVGSNGYLTRGGWWQTLAVVSAQPRLNASTDVVKWTATNTGSIWTFQYNLNGSVVPNWFLKAGDPNPNDGSVFTDNPDGNTWNVVQTDPTNHIYSIQVPNTYGGYDAVKYLGSAITTESTNMGIANTVRYNRASGDSYTQWKFVSQDDLDLYNARVRLDKYMTYAKNKALDISSDIATYNTVVTADISSAADALLTALGRTDVTASITNPSFETNDFNGWTNNGFNTQGNDPGQGWTKAGTYYVEKYTGSGWNDAHNLAAGTLTQTVSGLSSGLYELVVSGHAVQQGGSNPLHTGAYITAGSQTTQVDAGHDDYSISNITVSGSTLTIGYALVDPVACNWTGFDNFRLYYYGPAVLSATQAELDALQVQITAATALLASTTEGTAVGQYTAANRTVLSDAIASATIVYNNAIQAYVNPTTSSLSAAITTYNNSIIVATNQLANGDYFISIGGRYVNDPGSPSILDGSDPKISNNGLQSQINIANGSQIYTIAKISGCDRTTPISRYTFFNAATSRNLSESASYKDTWGGSVPNEGDDPWRSQNIYYNGTDYAIQAAGGSAYWGMWYLKNGNELSANSIVRTPIAADYVITLIPVSTVFSQQVDAGRTAFDAVTPSDAVGQYNAAKCSAFQTALATAEAITAGTATKENLYAYSAALQLFVANANLTFTGDANWSNTASWSPSRLPNSGDYVTASSGTLTIDQDVTVYNLTINPEAKVTLSLDKTLTVTGNFAINSDANGTGTYIDNGTTTTTNVTVQQYLTGGTPDSRCWYLTTPVVSSTSNAFTPATNYLWSYNETERDLASVYTRITATNESLTPGTGYVARMTANGNISLSGASLFNEDKAFTDLTRASIDLTKQGFHLIGNPYPCYLDITTAFTGSTDFETSAWYSSSTNGTSNVFDTFNASTGASITNNSGVTASLAIIPPMQAFWVRAINATNSLTFSKTMRSHKPATGNNLRSAATSDVKQIRLNVSNGTNTDQTLIGFYAQAMDEFDNCDSRKMFNGVANLPEIYSLAGSTIVAINGLPLLTDTREIALGFKTAQAGSFTIKAAEILNLEADETVILKDKLLNVSQNLTDQPVYSFSSDAVTTTSRFSIVIGKMATALKLAQKSSFEVRALNNGQMEIALDGATQASVKVFDTVGRQVFAQDILSQTSPLRKTFSKGVYLVKVSIGGVENTKKVVINL